jgi:hypothetical protein
MSGASRRRLLLSTVGISAAGLGSARSEAPGAPAQPPAQGNSPPFRRTAAEAAAGIMPIDYECAPGDLRRYGGDPSGMSDSTAALASASKVGEPITAVPGTYLVISSVAIEPTVKFRSGSIFKPARTVTITFAALSSYIQAGPYQIFDLSLGGLISLPQRNSVCPAEWWGAKGDHQKTDNDVPINQALLAVSDASAAVSGGEVTLERGVFFTSGTINLRPNTWLRGKGKFYTVIKAASSFRPNEYMVIAKNESHPMFNCPIVDLRLDANDDPNIPAVIYAPAWQQKCGTQNVYISNFKRYGIRLDTGYGGAAQLTIRQTEIYASADPLPSSACIIADYSQGVVGWINVTLQEADFGCAQATVTLASDIRAGATSASLGAPWRYESGIWNIFFSSGENRLASVRKGDPTLRWSRALTRDTTSAASGVSPNGVGILAIGRVVLACLDVHSEFITTAFLLRRAATVGGTAIKADGNNSIQALFRIEADWTGNINATNVKIGGASNLIVDVRRPYPLANQVPPDDQLVWPPNAARAFAAANVIGGASPVVAYGMGIKGVSHIDTGVQRVALLTAASDLSAYDVTGTSADPSAPILCIRKRAVDAFDVVTGNASGAATDAEEFSVKVYHRG